jgi:hypothetical protein
MLPSMTEGTHVHPVVIRIIASASVVADHTSFKTVPTKIVTIIRELHLFNLLPKD